MKLLLSMNGLLAKGYLPAIRLSIKGTDTDPNIGEQSRLVDTAEIWWSSLLHCIGT